MVSMRELPVWHIRREAMASATAALIPRSMLSHRPGTTSFTYDALTHDRP
jgi:hypothetical protein